MALKTQYSFDLIEGQTDKHMQAIPVNTFIIENDFCNFPTALEIATYIKENKFKFLTYSLQKNVEIHTNSFIKGGAYITVQNNNLSIDYYISNIKKL